MSSRVASGTGTFRGRATNWRPHPRQRKLADPAGLCPLRTTWVAWHRGQGGIGATASAESGIRPDYEIMLFGPLPAFRS